MEKLLALKKTYPELSSSINRLFIVIGINAITVPIVIFLTFMTYPNTPIEMLVGQVVLLISIYFIWLEISLKKTILVQREKLKLKKT